MLSSLLPPEVAVAEVFGDPEDAVLLPGEEAVIARAVEKRQREYTTTRHLARTALAEWGSRRSRSGPAGTGSRCGRPGSWGA